MCVFGFRSCSLSFHFKMTKKQKNAIHCVQSNVSIVSWFFFLLLLLRSFRFVSGIRYKLTKAENDGSDDIDDIDDDDDDGDATFTCISLS